MSAWTATMRRLSDAVYMARGTRGLAFAAGLLLLMAALEPALPDAIPPLAFTLPLFLVLMVGFLTLPREAVAVQWRARTVLDDPAATRRMMQRAVWGVLVCVSLLPNVFLAVQGIPHLSPLAGLAQPDLVRWIGLMGMLVVLFLVVMYLRSSRSYAPQIVTPRPGELDERGLARRDVLAVSILAIVVAWAWMLQGFWRPFSLLEWHGGDLDAYLASLRLGARGLVGIAFAVLPPALLFIVLSAHLDLLWLARRRGLLKERKKIVYFALAHVAFCVLGTALHTYNLLWIVRYRSLGFF